MSDDNKTVKLSDKDKKYWSNRIDSEVREKRQELERAIELKVDNQIKTKYKKFISTLKLASKLTALKKASKEYDDFVKLKELKEVAQKYNEAMADGKLSAKEKQDLAKESMDVVSAVLKLFFWKL